MYPFFLFFYFLVTCMLYFICDTQEVDSSEIRTDLIRLDKGMCELTQLHRTNIAFTSVGPKTKRVITTHDMALFLVPGAILAFDDAGVAYSERVIHIPENPLEQH